MKNKIIVTGGASFIGSEFVRQIIKRGFKIIVIDKLTYAGDLARLGEVKGKIEFYKADISCASAIGKIFKKEKPKQIVHFAAESHVDRSILSSDEFIRTNIQGTQVLLDAAKLSGIEKFVHISTDEVYGDIEEGQFCETTPLKPSSPYSASKAAADLLVGSYVRTFKFPAVIVRPSNNYGQWQYPEKFIPVIIYKALKGQRIPVYGKGLNVREWLHVSDCAGAIGEILKKGKIGEIYNVGSGNERKNIDVARAIIDFLGKPHSLIEFVQDRPGHDLRYSLNFSKIKKEIGWQAEYNFDCGIKDTIGWYKDNFNWLEKKAEYLRGYWKKVYV
ncbi:MAG: dTDP-glucose 4,6-dehydratase [Candidatus Omnitrophota bacterium]|jgi:dTDP-glucose 4,6-dehydratase